MKSLARKLRYQPVRQSTAKSLDASADATDSGTMSLNNSQGTSRSLADFSQQLNESFEIGGELISLPREVGSIADQSQRQGNLSARLAEAAEKFHNNRLGTIGKQWLW